MKPIQIAPLKLLAFALLAAGVPGSGLGSFGQGSSGNRRAGTSQEYHRFALLHEGDASQGRKIFADEQRVSCSKCHSVDGKGGQTGPDLSAAGDQFARRDLIEAVLAPSARIAVG